MSTYRTYNIAALVQFEAQDCIKGVFINPRLPADFNDTSNESRPFDHMIWWGRPYVTGSDERGWAVRCLDGGAWDRSTWLSNHETLDEAVAAAHQALLHPKYIAEVASLEGLPGAFGMKPVEWQD